MMTAKEVIEKALFDHTVDEVKEKPRIVFLQEYDMRYWNFFTEISHVDLDKISYYQASLYVVTRETYPESALICTMTGTEYDPGEVVEAMANVMERMISKWKKGE